jgi:hypothetical protein
MPLNTQSDISTYMQTIYEDAMFVAREMSIMPSLVLTFDNETDEARTRTRSEYGEATIADIGETDDLSSQAFTPSTAQVLTPGEAGAQIFLTDKRISADPFGARDDASRELGMVTAKKINTDLLGELANLTGGTVGSAGTTITWGHFFAALAQLEVATKKSGGPYFCVLHEYQWFQLAKSAAVAQTVTNAPNFQDDIMRSWYKGTVGPVDIHVTTDLTIDGSGDATGGMFDRQAIAYDERRPFRLEPQRDASRRGWELNATTVYAHGVWRPKFGIKMVFDAATPDS